MWVLMPTPPVARGAFTRSCSCGWSSTRETERRAEHALLRHSCERALRLAAQHERHTARMAAVDRTPKPCHHQRVTHEHGTYACYRLDDCRCEPCAAAVADYNSNRARQVAYGRWDKFVDAAPVLAHVRSLQAAGMGRRRIVAVSGVSDTVLQRLMTGTQVRIRRENAKRLLALTPDPADGALIDAAPTRNRLRALAALGWTQTQLAARLGFRRTNFVLVSDRPHCRAIDARRTAALYDELSMQLPPEPTAHRAAAVRKARERAAAAGWVPPLAVDDERLDDPAYNPHVGRPQEGTRFHEEVDPVVVQRILSCEVVEANAAERREVVAKWESSGRALNELERLTGWNVTRYTDRLAAAS